LEDAREWQQALKDVILLPYGLTVKNMAALADALESALSDLGFAYTGDYTCTYCGKASPKYEWGAGRITCPECGKTAPSPADSRATKIEPVPGLMSAHFCEHANEVPSVCPCPANCYCKGNTCRTV
jgi:hypothetical protein